ncbi:MAG: PIN domain-containing protein [Planctomycetes bacterium]|nr:PIN domain-containing protein [Planctomycetota bacterium]
MVLVDTSVWIDFLREGSSKLEELLNEGGVSTHPLIIGELACGNIQDRKKFLSLLNDLPIIQESTHEEVLHFIEKHKSFGLGVGFFDLHILCSAIINNNSVWTLDRRLKKLCKLHHRHL